MDSRKVANPPTFAPFFIAQFEITFFRVFSIPSLIGRSLKNSIVTEMNKDEGAVRKASESFRGSVYLFTALRSDGRVHCGCMISASQSFCHAGGQVCSLELGRRRLSVLDGAGVLDGQNIFGLFVAKLEGGVIRPVGVA